MKVGLECFVGRTRIAIPVEAVDQIIEYELTSPLPLARDFVGGVGAHEQRVIVSVEIERACAERSDAASAARARMAKGVLLDVKGSPVAWALEVAHVASFVRVQIGGDAPLGEGHRPPWLLGAVTLDDGQPIVWVDVGAMIASLGGEESA